MKRKGNLFDSVIDFDNLLDAFHKAQLGKADREDVKAFRFDLNANIATLRNDIINDTLCLGSYHYFMVHDPKTRLICAANFPERVVHHALINIIGPLLDSHMISHSFACRKGKGQHKALSVTLCFSRRHPYYFQMDIRKCFDSIPHERLKKMLASRFKDEKLLRLCSRIIDSYHAAPGAGLPIGNLTSQYFANAYLDIFDHWIKESCRMKSYLRYMDDMLMFGKKDELLELRGKCGDFLATELGLILKNGGTINSVEKGIGFLGCAIFPKGIRLSKRTKKRVRTKFHRYEEMWEKGFWNSETLQQRTESLWAGLYSANSYGWRCRLAKHGRDDV
ncbi:reverse transcriptase/maturase family protein [bacterium]|nr:reverse transcriptase/maturase family protein [bacterium]